MMNEIPVNGTTMNDLIIVMQKLDSAGNRTAIKSKNGQIYLEIN